MHQRTIFGHISVVSPSKVVEVLFLKQGVDDSGNVIFERFHNTTVPPGMDVDRWMEIINKSLEESGFAPVADYSELKKICAVVHTPEVVEAYMAQ